MRENREQERTELDMLLERYDALVSEARGLEEQVKLRLLADRKAKLGPRNAARRIGMSRGAMAKKMNGHAALYPEEIAGLREPAGKAGRA